MTGTGLLTERCDPYGAESTIRLMGGIFPDSRVGKYMWHCDERATGRFRLVCRGGDYGQRQAPDGGMVAAYSCPGGHRGVVMPLCPIHIREFNAGPPKPGYDSSHRPYGQVGGTKATEMCPACAAPPAARELMGTAEQLHQAISAYHAAGIGMAVPRSLISQQDQIRAAIDELRERGIVHKCPLTLVEVS